MNRQVSYRHPGGRPVRLIWRAPLSTSLVFFRARHRRGWCAPCLVFICLAWQHRLGRARRGGAKRTWSCAVRYLGGRDDGMSLCPLEHDSGREERHALVYIFAGGRLVRFGSTRLGYPGGSWIGRAGCMATFVGRAWGFACDPACEFFTPPPCSGRRKLETPVSALVDPDWTIPWC